MRTLGLVGLSLALVVASAFLGDYLSTDDGVSIARVRSEEPRLDEARRSLEALRSRLRRTPPKEPDISSIEKRMGRLERRVAELDRPASAAPPTAPASYEDMVERADARGGFWEAYPEIVAEEIAAWESAAAQAADAEQRSAAWAEVARLYGTVGDHESMKRALLRVIESAGLGVEKGWTAARQIAISEWGHGDIAATSRIFLEIGNAPVPEKVAMNARLRAAQLALAGVSLDESIRLYREFVSHYRDSRDPTIMRCVAYARRSVITLESRKR